MEKKNLWYILGGAAAIIAGAVAYHFLTSGQGEDEEEESKADLKWDLESVKEIKKDPNGIIKLDDFITLFKIVTRHAKRKIQ